MMIVEDKFISITFKKKLYICIHIYTHIDIEAVIVGVGERIYEFSEHLN
jgi:hypothetical protein